MQFKAIRNQQYVHIIFFWVVGLILGMVFYYHFKEDFMRILLYSSTPISFPALLLSSFLPLLLFVIFLRFRALFLCCFIILLKAFLYGFSFIQYAGVKPCLILFSQTNSCILLFLLFFLQKYKPELSRKSLYLVFLFSDLILIIFDYFVICPIYS